MTIGHHELGRQLVELLPRLRRFALVLTRSADAADDLVQGSVARALERREQWEDGTRLDRWVFQIIKSVWLNSLKSARIRQMDSLDDHADPRGLDGASAMEAKLTLDEVRATFAGLPQAQQEALLLVCVEGYSYKEAAELLDLPMGTVVSRIARGRQALIDRQSASSQRPAEDNVTKLRWKRD